MRSRDAGSSVSRSCAHCDDPAAQAASSPASAARAPTWLRVLVMAPTLHRITLANVERGCQTAASTATVAWLQQGEFGPPCFRFHATGAGDSTRHAWPR